MNNNTQLPAEVVELINKDAEHYVHQAHMYFGGDENSAYIAGATEYATKAHEAQQETDKLKTLSAEWRPLLEDVLRLHETGLLPDRFIYEKIKKFLYGE